MVDLRNIYEPNDMVSAGFSYTSIGRPILSSGVERERKSA